MWPLSRKTPAERIAEAIEADNFGIARDLINRTTKGKKGELNWPDVSPPVCRAFYDALRANKPSTALKIYDGFSVYPSMFSGFHRGVRYYTESLIETGNQRHDTHAMLNRLATHDPDLKETIRAGLAEMLKPTTVSGGDSTVYGSVVSFILEPRHRDFYAPHITQILMLAAGVTLGRGVHQIDKNFASCESQRKAKSALESLHTINGLLAAKEDEPLRRAFTQAVQEEGICVSFSVQPPLAILDRQMIFKETHYPESQPLSVFCIRTGYHRTPEGYAAEVGPSRRGDLIKMLKQAAVLEELTKHEIPQAFPGAGLITDVIKDRYPQATGYQLKLPRKAPAPQQA